VKINLHVEPTMLADSDFQSVLLQMCTYLSLENKIKNLCLHETGHLMFFEPIRELMGPNIPELKFVGPTIVHNVLTGKFEPTFAAVETPFHAYSLVYTDEVLDWLALGAVSGGVFLQDLRHETDGGDDVDRDIFHMHFLKARGQGITPKLSEDQMWNDAKDKVRRHLQNDAFKRSVLKMANDLEIEHFSLQQGS
jgi:hypothetical protein